MVNEVQRWIDDSQFDNWQWYFFIGAVAISGCIHYEIYSVTSMLKSLDTTIVLAEYTMGDFVIASLQGIVMGMVGKQLYTQGDSYSKFVTDNFTTKEMTFIARIGVMTMISIIVGLILPDIVSDNADYITVQVGGTVILAGNILIHSEIRNWRVMNEAPVLAAGGLLAVAPML